MSDPVQSSVGGTQEKRLLPQFPAKPNIDSKHEWMGAPMGGASLTEPQKRKIKVYCAHRDGYKCMYCKLEAQLYELTVHHVDRIVWNNYSDNLQNMHWDCNLDARWGKPPRRLQAQLEGMVSTPTPKKEGEELSGLTPERKQLLEDERTTPSQKTNLENEPKYFEACFQETKDMADPTFVNPDKYMNKRQIMSYAMAISGASQDASYGYNRKLFAPRVGPLIEEAELGGKMKTVKFRDSKDYNLSIEQLMKKYPPEGQAYAS